jgi:hypothetical protein
MESGDGGWICAEVAWPDGGSGLGGKPALGEDDGWPATVREPSAGKGWGRGGVPGFSAWIAVTIAMVAAAAGVAVGFFLIS